MNSHQNRWEKDNDSNGLVPSKYGITQHDNDKYRIFNGDGYLRDAELKVMNFKPWGCKSNTIKGKCWEEVNHTIRLLYRIKANFHILSTSQMIFKASFSKNKK